MDDEPMWAVDRVVAPTRGFAITIPDTTNEFSIKAGGIFLYKTPNQAYQLLKDKVLLKLDWAKNQKSKPSFKKTVAFADEGSSNSDTEKIMARMDAMTMKMDAQFTDKQSGSPFGSLPSNTQPNPKGSSSKPYQPPQARNEQVNVVFTRSGKSYDPPINPNDSETPISFNSEDEDDEPTPQPKPKDLKPVKENPIPKPYKPKIPYPQRLKKNKWKLNMHKFEQISAAFLSDESSALIQNKVPPKLGDPESFLIPCNFNKAFSCDALVYLGASINLMPYSLYAKLSLETLKPNKMSVRLADRSFQYPVGIAENMLVEVGIFTFPVDFVILEMEEDSKVPLILGRPFLHTANAVIRVKQKQLNHKVGTPIDVIDEILEEYFDALLDEGSKILYSIEGTILEEKLFAEFDGFMTMTSNMKKT
ncbi:reverse transcriptase domain-containing protein [Tanacetum coccineum]